jgi:hypothetical protein
MIESATPRDFSEIRALFERLHLPFAAVDEHDLHVIQPEVL